MLGTPSVNGIRPEGQHSQHRLFCKVDCVEWSTCRMSTVLVGRLSEHQYPEPYHWVRSNVSWHSWWSGSWPCTGLPSAAFDLSLTILYRPSVNRALLQLHTIDLFWHWSRQSPFAWNRSLGSSNYKLLAQQEILVKSYIRLATMWGWMQSCLL